jgi:hypothetical protein
MVPAITDEGSRRNEMNNPAPAHVTFGVRHLAYRTLGQAVGRIDTKGHRIHGQTAVDPPGSVLPCRQRAPVITARSLGADHEQHLDPVDSVQR